VTQPRKTPYASVSMRLTVKNEVQRLVLELSLDVDRRLTPSDVIHAALAVARDHRDELLTALESTREEA
jgi:hypothetical protein